jgi:fructoselysine-6-P-deglycase FrlB-like protein
MEERGLKGEDRRINAERASDSLCTFAAVCNLRHAIAVPETTKLTTGNGRAREVQVGHLLELDDAIEKLGEEFVDSCNFLYLGRGYNFPAALEGALKLKERRVEDFLGRTPK